MTSRTFWVAPAILFALDRILKATALQGLSFSLFGGAVRFVLFQNGGIAFSLPASGPIVWGASLAIIAAVLASAWKDWQLGEHGHFVAYTMFFLGAVSNLIDRIAWGYTDDYLMFFNRSAVNLADGMILVGALWLVFARPTPKRPSKIE
jgi:signal peptidase II